MGKVYDDWGRLVEAVLRREKLRQLCYAHSATSSDCSSVFNHDFRHLHLHPKMTMVRLQEELIYTLTQNKQCFEHGYMSPPTSASTVTSPRHSISSECEDFAVDLLDPDTIPQLKASADTVFASEFEDCVVDLLDPDKIPQIKAIADTMFASNCDREFCEVFVRFGKAAFEVYFSSLDVEEIGCEDAVLMDWNLLHSSIKTWRCAINRFVVLYIYKAKLVFDQVLADYGDAGSSCLIEASTPFLMRFLNVGESLAVGLNRPEHLFTLLDMHRDLTELIPSLESSFPDEMASYILAELHNLLARLGSRVKAILKEFRNMIRTTQFSRIHGGIYPLSRYVVNYILLFKEYDPTLTLILEDRNREDSDADAEQSTLAAHLLSITSTLEAKITDMSNLCNDTSLEHIFVMNNIHYMVARINNSKLKDYFGDEWVKRRTVTFRAHALSYLRSTWSLILPLLRYDMEVNRATIKARYKDFTTAFEHVYENQTRWVVPNLELRQELKISASTVLVSAYRPFVVSMEYRYGVRNIRYTAEELETMIMDLLENSSKSLSHRQRKGIFSSSTSVFDPP